MTYDVSIAAGNEADVETYVNFTGLMWELGDEMSALLIFAEVPSRFPFHRHVNSVQMTCAILYEMTFTAFVMWELCYLAASILRRKSAFWCGNTT
jgi:hypothetical protein